jgi:hypothetical protein
VLQPTANTERKGSRKPVFARETFKLSFFNPEPVYLMMSIWRYAYEKGPLCHNNIHIFFFCCKFSDLFNQSGGGGTFLSLLTVVEKIRRIWREKVFLDVVLTVSRELSPKETIKVIETIYWNCIRKPNISNQ